MTEPAKIEFLTRSSGDAGFHILEVRSSEAHAFFSRCVCLKGNGKSLHSRKVSTVRATSSCAI
jgi:hypothetical protein